MKVEYLQPKQISVGERARKTMGNLDTLVQSILEKGIIQPITLDTNRNLVAGERRLEAFKLAQRNDPANKNIKEGIPTISRKIEDKLDHLEIELMENIARKDMEWYERVELTASIHKLFIKKFGKKHSITKTAELIGKGRSTVSTTLEMARALKALPVLKEVSDEAKAAKVYKRLLEDAVVKDHITKSAPKTGGAVDRSLDLIDRYVVGDTLEKLFKVKPNNWHFAEVDPPYGIDLVNLKSEGTTGIDQYNEIDKKEYPAFLKKVAEGVYRALADNTWCVWWHGPTWHEVVKNTLLDAGFRVDDIPAIWYKLGSQGVSINPDVNLARQYEPFFVARKGADAILRGRGHGNVFMHKTVPAKKKIHPTERPLELMEDIIQTFCFPKARIIIPFLGSGNTLLAAYNCGMGYSYGWDLSKELKKRYMSRCVARYGDRG